MSAPCLPVVSHPHKRRRRTDTDSVSHGAIASSIPDEGDDDHSHDGFEDIETIDATEYLSRVVNQAKKLPEFFVADSSSGGSPTTSTGTKDGVQENHRQFVPIDGSAASLFYLLSGRASLTRPPSHDYLPHTPNKWTETSLGNFETLRNYLENCREQGVGGKLTDRVAFPPMKDRAGWHLFCVGSEEAVGNMNSYFGDDYKKPNTAGEETTLPAWCRGIPTAGHPPTVKVVSQMDQVLVRQALSHLCHYIGQGWKLTAQRTSWIYALLARLEKPIHRDEASTLFGLLKVLTMARSKMNLSVQGRAELSRMNLLIVIVGVYFEQGASIVMSVLDD